ncbi:MAG: SET domain-containing protein-lysine N-methyltransferase [Filimonas sp.]|nr:SET domain-containing protein-lysine N-methyltransferase [Filimonas sp.]
MMMPYLTVAPSEKGGRGVFSTQNIPAGTVIEISPVLVFNSKERKAIEDTRLFNYIFEWGATRKMGALGMGYISMYNHDYSANCNYEMDYENALMTITTVKPVKAGDELCINYNADPDDKTPVWFHH